MKRKWRCKNQRGSQLGLMRRKKIAIVEQLRGTVENEEEMETQNQGWSQLGAEESLISEID